MWSTAGGRVSSAGVRFPWRVGRSRHRVEVSIREIANGEVRLELTLQDSQVIAGGTLYSPPVVATEELEAVLDVHAGGVYLVGSFVHERANDRLTLNGSRERSCEIGQHWARVAYVGRRESVLSTTHSECCSEIILSRAALSTACWTARLGN